MNGFISGAAGLIGNQVAHRFLAAGQVGRGDLRAPEPWEQATVASDLVVQTAATFDADMGPADHMAMAQPAHHPEAVGPPLDQQISATRLRRAGWRPKFNDFRRALSGCPGR